MKLASSLKIALLSLFLAISFGLRAQSERNGQAIRVVLDPGHGGRDSVTRGGGHLEKDIVLNVSKDIAAYLKDQGIDVILTRNKDEYVSLSDRASVKGDIFISVHANSVADSIGPSVRSMIKGIEIYTERSMQNDALLRKSKILASAFRKPLSNIEGIPFRGIRQKALAVLELNRSPAILIELGFLSNEEDLKFLVDKENYKKLSIAFADAIKSYLSSINTREMAK